MRDHGWSGPLEWAVAGRALPSETESGDGWAVAEQFDADGRGTTLFAVIDGLGHGTEAAAATRAAVAALRGRAGQSPQSLLRRCHQTLSQTRGAAITLATIEHPQGLMWWLGVGNVAASLVRSGPAGSAVHAVAMLRGGVVGQQLPDPLQPLSATMERGDLLLIGTDGLAPGFGESSRLAGPVTDIAEDLLTRCALSTDDALVLAARYHGAPA